ncbi:efflux RND transporter periplasmic adaptor subunit [Hymenobacter sp. B1770]|uniref:efflux RND transporter periplasmic adaptor subunit n=1 Tax=Hymenobacter sp. B1770 TaxID=1718788 RepID=UPI003CF8C4A5
MLSNKRKVGLLFLLLTTSLTNCGRQDDHAEPSATPTDATATSATAALGSYYTCSMHPEVHQDHPGNCPICGMTLTKTTPPAMQPAGSTTRVLNLSEEQIRLGNIQVATVGPADASGPPSQSPTATGLRLTGRVVLNPENLVQVSARVPGRIERLYVRAAGEAVRAGAPLYAIYSEELLKAQQEFLLARTQQRELAGNGIDYAPLAEAARTRLRLWGMTPAQLNALARSGKVLNPLPYYSPSAGVVQELNLREGDYLSEGMAVMKLADLRSVWVEAQLYATDQPLRAGQPVQVSFPAYPGQHVSGRVSFISPELAGDSKVTLVRVQIPNPNQQYTPGLQAFVETVAALAAPANQASVASSLRVPVDAVLQGANGNTLWVHNPDGGFEMRMVQIGRQTSEQVEIISNLKAGEQVVVNGAYLLNSEYILQKGASSMAGMEGMKM